MQTLTERLTRAYDASPVGNCYLDKDLRYLHINSWLAEINGISVSEHLGRPIGEVLPGDASSVIDQLTSVLETGTPILDGIVTGETPSQPGVLVQITVTDWGGVQIGFLNFVENGMFPFFPFFNMPK